MYGVIISLVMKHSSNIYRLFMIGAATILTTIISYFLFGYRVNGYFIISIITILVALFLYSEKNEDLVVNVKPELTKTMNV